MNKSTIDLTNRPEGDKYYLVPDQLYKVNGIKFELYPNKELNRPTCNHCMISILSYNDCKPLNCTNIANSVCSKYVLNIIEYGK